MNENNAQNQTQEIAKRIEAILFWKGEPLHENEISKFLNMDEETSGLLKETDIKTALSQLEYQLKDRGIRLAKIEDTYTLLTSVENSKLIEKLQTEELKKDLGKATLETLALIIYKGPIKRIDIDNIRGVNSSYILRSLMVRGLIDKSVDPKNSRVNIYKPSFELLAHLGIENVNKLPNYEEVLKELNKFNEDFIEQKENIGGETSTAE